MKLIERALARTSALMAVVLWATVPAWPATTRHVWPDSPVPAPPYADWTTAAHVIQDAVDAAEAGDLVLVTNGVYATGGKAVAPATLTNRVAVTKPLRLASVNGPQATIIQGAKAPGGGNGDAAVRCVYLADGASLSGFTLTNGATRISRTWPASDEHEIYGGGAWGGSTNAVLTDCVLTGNLAPYGGGAYRGTLNNCTLTGNSATCGGGAYECTLKNCVLTGNSALEGGGAREGRLANCTLTGNRADWVGGGTFGGTLHNCIVYFNTAVTRANYYNSTLNYCCTTPLPGGQGNLSLDPLLASTSHLSAGSPCRGAGSADYATGVDLDGEAWATSPAIGCDEYHAGAATGPLGVGISAAVTNVVVGYSVRLTGLIDGRTSASEWNFGDGETATNKPYTVHAWSAPGEFPVVLRAVNESQPQGVSATVVVRVVAAVHYVAVDSLNPSPPFTSWATAARNLQDAVDAATVTGALVLVTNGTYAAGGRAVGTNVLVNRVAVDKPLSLASVNGPQATIIQGAKAPGSGNGDGAVRCVYLAEGASLSGFTLANGATGIVGAGQESVDGQNDSGGGVWCESGAVVVTNCVMVGNSASNGGGAYQGTLNNCTLTGNSASVRGGGAYDGTLNNCVLTGNWADGGGGGAYQGALNNCTLTGNSTGDRGGGAAYSVMNNCIVYFNQAWMEEANHSGSTLNYCCTTPLPDGGQGNLSLDPQLASASHLSAGSPCRGAGSADHASGVDLDGEAWATPPAIGCDEYYSGTATGILRVGIGAAVTNVVVGNPANLTALIEGRPAASTWEFGDGETAANQPYTAHAWSAPGDYAVVLRAYNASQPQGVSATVTVRVVVVAAVHYVAAESPEPQAPYTSWATAARNLRDAVDAAAFTGALVLVSNGTYAGGVRVTKPLALRSVNGPGVTVIKGGSGIQGGGVYLASGASLAGFTVTEGGTEPFSGGGGGVFAQSSSSVITGCVLKYNSGYYGGGAFGGTLNNCTLTGNSAWEGGGAYASTLNNCTLTGNSATLGGGGVSYGTLNNCILYLNDSSHGRPGAPHSLDNGHGTLNYCCTTPLPAEGVGNISAEPLFLDLAGGNLRLRANSPCINAGNNASASGDTDLDGRPRIVGGRVDMGAYEFQPNAPGHFIAWLLQFSLPTDGSADFADPDADGRNTWQEWRCQTEPTNALSVLRLLSATPAETGVTVSWPGVDGVTYFLERSVDLGVSPPFSPLATNLSGPSGIHTFTDTNAAASPRGFYRVGVGP